MSKRKFQAGASEVRLMMGYQTSGIVGVVITVMMSMTTLN
jgi:hypothetical protein